MSLRWYIARELMLNFLGPNNLLSMFKKMTCTDSVQVTKRKPAIWSHPITVCVLLYLFHWWKVSDLNLVNFLMTVFENLPGSRLVPLTDVLCLLSQWGFLVCQVYNEGSSRFELYCIKKTSKHFHVCSPIWFFFVYIGQAKNILMPLSCTRKSRGWDIMCGKITIWVSC